MKQLVNSVKTITFIERTLLLVNLLALMVRYVFHYEATLFMEVFAILLALLYFPFGFYAIGKPTERSDYTIPVILGLVYALGVMSLLICAANIDSYRYPLIADFFVLLAIVVYLLYRMRKLAYPPVFINTQYIRMAYIVFCALIIIIGSPLG